MRCAIYTRVSTDEQAMSEYSSLRRQEEICRNYIDIHTEKGWKVAGVYEDAGYSGKDFQRPGIQELMEEVRGGNVDVIVTYKIDRISRSLKDFYDLWEVLKAHNVTFVSATQHFDTSDSMGMLILNILLSFAQFERELARERTMSKMAGRAEKGMWNGGHPPLGFDYDRDTQTLQPNLQETPIVRFIYQRVIDTRSACAVANEANARGYRTRVRTQTRRDGSQQQIGGKRFDEDMVAAIVHNPIYKGFVRYDGMLYPGKHEAIVDEETWAHASKAIGSGRDDDTGLYYRDQHTHLLKGILCCASCGLAMTPYRSGKKTPDGTPYLYYACVDYTKQGSQTSCPIKMLPAREFESLIRQALADLGSQPAILQACVEAANREAAHTVSELEGTLARHRDELGQLSASIRRLIEVMKEEDLLAEDIKDEYRRLVREKERLQGRCERLELDLERRRKRVLDAGLIRRALEDFDRLVGLLPLEDQKELFRPLLREVDVAPLEPGREPPKAAAPTAERSGHGGAGAAAGSRRVLKTRIRARWYRVRIGGYQLPGLPDPRSVNHSGKRSGSGEIGSATRIRTWNLPVNSRPLYR